MISLSVEQRQQPLLGWLLSAVCVAGGDEFGHSNDLSCFTPSRRQVSLACRTEEESGEILMVGAESI